MGAVVNVRVMSDRNDPKKGYAFVEYDNPDTALAAIQNLSNIDMDGRRVSLSITHTSSASYLFHTFPFNMNSSGWGSPIIVVWKRLQSKEVSILKLIIAQYPAANPWSQY